MSMDFCCDARTANNHFPGIGRYVFNLIRAMSPHLREDERLTVLWDSSQPSLWDLSRVTGDRVRMVEATVSPFSLRQQWILPALLRDLQVNTYHSPYYLMPYCCLPPTVVTAHDLIPLTYPLHVSSRARLLFRLLTRLAMRTARCTIAVSEATRSDLTRYFRRCETKTVTIPSAADPEFRPQPGHEIERVRRQYKLPDRFVLYVGINKPHKNLPRLMDAWSLVSRKSGLQYNPQLLIAGMWDDRYPEIEERIEGLTDVRRLGPIAEQDLPALYSGAEFFVYPSLYEGFGLPVLEAMACGTAIACSRIPALLEVAGEAALLFDPLSAQSIAAELNTILGDESVRLELEKRSLRRAKQFSWDRTAGKTLEIYRRCAGSAEDHNS